MRSGAVLEAPAVDLEAMLVDAINAAAATAEATKAEVAAKLTPTDDRRADIEQACTEHAGRKVTGRRKRNGREDRFYKTPVDTRDGDGLLTEGAAFSRAQDWGLSRSHGVPETGGIAGGEFTVTFTDMTQVSVDLKTGKVRKLRTIDIDRGSPDADVKPRMRAAANTNVVTP